MERIKGMLADDEVNILNNLRTVVPWEEFGIDIVGMAKDGEDALQIFRESQPEFILCDIRMPGMDGIELIEQINQEDAQCEIVMLTGHKDFEYMRSSIRSGVRDYLLKPIDYEELQEVVERAAADIRMKQLKNTVDEKDQLSQAYKMVQQDLHLPPGKHEGHLRLADGVPLKRNSETLMIAAEDYIHKNLGDDIGIDDLAAYLEISSSYFSMLFKRHFDETFVEYLTRRRMEQAEILMTTTNLSIAKIAKQLGYLDRRYFTKVFRKYAGMIPSEYREQHQKIRKD